MSTLDFESLWHALPIPCLLIDANNRFQSLNSAAELFLSLSANSLVGRGVEGLMPPGSRPLALLDQARRDVTSVAEYGLEITLPDLSSRLVDAQAAPFNERPGWVVLTLTPRSMAEKIDRSLGARGAARSLSGMAAMLTHEIKNPLAGISGAAQLLEMNASDEDAELTRLIQEEVERVRKLLEQFEAFGDHRPPVRQAVNIHLVLDQVRRAAAAGYARHVRFREEYDPSLPDTPADRDQLVQLFSNLIKNAAEAVPNRGGEILLRTAYRPGVKVAAPGGARESLPLEVIVADNGPGIAEDMRAHIFEPFVTTKAGGSGLGLALVSKVVADHGGVIECTEWQGRTAFRVLLSIMTEEP